MAHIKHYILITGTDVNDAAALASTLLEDANLTSNNWHTIDAVINFETNECTSFDGDLDYSLNEIKQEFIEILKNCPTNEEITNYINDGCLYPAQNAINQRIAYISALKDLDNIPEKFDFNTEIFEYEFTEHGFTDYSDKNGDVSGKYLVVVDVHI